METRFGEREIAKRADPRTTGEDRTVTALADAHAEIDACLAVWWRLPLPDGDWPLLRSIACDLARGRLYDDQHTEEPKRLLEAARKMLEGLKTGETQLVDAAGNTAPVRNRVQRSGPDPVMTRENLAGFGGAF